MEGSWRELDGADDDLLSVLQSNSITCRIALGPQAGRKVFSLQTLPPIDIDEAHSAALGLVAGFKLHAGVAAWADQQRILVILIIHSGFIRSSDFPDAIS